MRFTKSESMYKVRWDVKGQMEWWDVQGQKGCTRPWWDVHDVMYKAMMGCKKPWLDVHGQMECTIADGIYKIKIDVQAHDGSYKAIMGYTRPDEIYNDT